MITALAIWVWGVSCVSIHLIQGPRRSADPWLVLADVLCWPLWLLVNVISKAIEFALGGEDDLQR